MEFFVSQVGEIRFKSRHATLAYNTLAVEILIDRLKRDDPTLRGIVLPTECFTDSHLAELWDCLIDHPDVGTRVILDINQLTDESGLKLARYVAASSTIKTLVMSRNQFDSATYLALAKALRVNTSLCVLSLHAYSGFQTVNKFQEFKTSSRPAETLLPLYTAPSPEQRG